MKKVLFMGIVCFFCTITVFGQSKKTWEKTQASNSISVYQDFLNKYPDGKYTELAKQQLSLLKEKEAKKNRASISQITNAKITPMK